MQISLFGKPSLSSTVMDNSEIDTEFLVSCSRIDRLGATLILETSHVLVSYTLFKIQGVI